MKPIWQQEKTTTLLQKLLRVPERLRSAPVLADDIPGVEPNEEPSTSASIHPLRLWAVHARPALFGVVVGIVLLVYISALPIGDQSTDKPGLHFRFTHVFRHLGGLLAIEMQSSGFGVHKIAEFIGSVSVALFVVAAWQGGPLGSSGGHRAGVADVFRHDGVYAALRGFNAAAMALLIPVATLTLFLPFPTIAATSTCVLVALCIIAFGPLTLMWSSAAWQQLEGQKKNVAKNEELCGQLEGKVRKKMYETGVSEMSVVQTIVFYIRSFPYVLVLVTVSVSFVSEALVLIALSGLEGGDVVGVLSWTGRLVIVSSSIILFLGVAATLVEAMGNRSCNRVRVLSDGVSSAFLSVGFCLMGLLFVLIPASAAQSALSLGLFVGFVLNVATVLFLRRYKDGKLIRNLEYRNAVFALKNERRWLATLEERTGVRPSDVHS